MAIEKSITKESFDLLLTWLDQNRESAGEKYEKIRQRLIRIFVGRGCFEAEELADETINRVILKIPEIVNNYSGDPVLYFYGVANYIHLEWLKKQKNISNSQFIKIEPHRNENDPEIECLESCLQNLPVPDIQLILEYYRKEKIAKIEYRRKLAENLGLTNNALQIKTSRIRGKLKGCVQNCLLETQV